MVKENGIIEVKGNMFDLVCLYRELEGVMCKVIGFNGGTYVLESIEDVLKEMNILGQN